MPALADDDRAGRHELAVAGLDAEPLADAVAAVLDAAACLLVGHRLTRPSSWRAAWRRLLRSARVSGQSAAGRRLGAVVFFAVAVGLAGRGLRGGAWLSGRGLRVGDFLAAVLAGRRPSRPRPWSAASTSCPPCVGRGLGGARPSHGELGGELGVLGGLRGRGLLEALALGLVRRLGLGRGLRGALAAERDVADAQDGQLLAMTLLDAAARLGAVLEADELLAAILAQDLGADRGAGHERLSDRRAVAVGDEEDAIDA